MATTPAAGNLDEVKKELAGRGLDTSFLSSTPSGVIDMRKKEKVVLTLVCPHCLAAYPANETMIHTEGCIDEGMF